MLKASSVHSHLQLTHEFLLIEVWAFSELWFSNPDLTLLVMCSGRSYVVCGDDRGRLWTYHISDLKAGKPVLPQVTINNISRLCSWHVALFLNQEHFLSWQILEWPTPLRNGFGKVEGTAINSVTMDPELQYLVAVTDKNMVLVWKRVV